MPFILTNRILDSYEDRVRYTQTPNVSHYINEIQIKLLYNIHYNRILGLCMS
jgi:hypothetical protein